MNISNLVLSAENMELENKLKPYPELNVEKLDGVGSNGLTFGIAIIGLILVFVVDINKKFNWLWIRQWHYVSNKMEESCQTK